MAESFRQMIERLDQRGQLLRIRKEVDLRHVSALIVQADRPVLFERVRGYDIPVVGGLFWTRDRLAKALDWPEAELGIRFLQGIRRAQEPVIVEEPPCQEVVIQGDEVDLSALPIPFLAERDGGPFISSGVAVAHDPELGLNAGVYRLMYRGKNETGIDLVTASDLRTFYERRLAKGEPLPVAVAIGVHGFDLLSAAYKAPPGVNEFALAGGLHGSPVSLSRCKTIDCLVPSDAEIVLEGEILPVGWTEDEGPFGEFAGMYGDVKWNPVFKVKAITHRRNPIFYALQMPWENAWLGGPVTEAQIWEVLQMNGIDVRAVRVTEGSACRWSTIVAIKKRAGEGKNAVLALLSLSAIKHAIVVDDDVDIFDPVEVEAALTFRVQADKDVIIISGAKAKHVDPSVRPWELPKGGLPLTAKMGIDATIPEGIPKQYYERIRPAFADRVSLADYL